MREILRYTLRLHDHVGQVTRRHFEFCSLFLSQIENDSDPQVYRAYLQELITDRAHYSDLTVEQRYLHDLGGLVSPVLSAYRLRLTLSRLKPRTGDIRASNRMEESCKHLAFAAYGFKERIKAFSFSVAAIITDESTQKETNRQISKIVRGYAQENDRIMRYRNFVVHGPKGRTDEFADLRSWELSAIFLHNDLWFDYNNAFEEAREEWISIACDVLKSMETAVAAVQTLNENLISQRSFRFLKAAPTAPAHKLIA